MKDEKFIKLIEEAVERGIQQRSGSHSSIIDKLNKMSIKQDAMTIEIQDLKDTLNGWKSGTKIAFWAFVFLGGIITWILNSFGIRIGLK